MAKDIVIILNQSVNAKDFSAPDKNEGKKTEIGTLIHWLELERVLEIIKKKKPQNGEDAKIVNLHNTITVLGTRGSGKTSFLLSVKKVVGEDKDIEVLDIIDPTLIEQKGHVFLNVISLIMDLVEKKLNKQECHQPDEKKSMFTRKEWRESLNKLAAGLPSIDGLASHNVDSWQDPEFVMDNGLKSVAASQKLAENFNEFLQNSLSVLEKDTFLLMFDDIDVDSSKGWAVLETIRKYFTNKRLITLISGDLKLYSTVVRQKKWDNFGKEILEYEGKHLGKLPLFNNMITELESQYLQKILQPANRIHLPTIGERKKYRPDESIYVYQTNNADQKNSEDDEISKLYSKVLKYFGIVNQYQAEVYYNYMLGLPVRSQIQFLSLFDLPTGEYSFKNAGPVALTDIFLSDLNAKAIDVNTAVNNPKSLNRIILNFLLEEKKLEELYQLQPITTQSTLNASLVGLNFLLSYNLSDDPYLIFDYFIKVGYIRNLVPLIQYRKSSESTLTPSIEDMCDNSIIINDNVLKDVAGKIIAYLRGTINKDVSNPDTVSKGGTIPLYGEALTSKGDKESMSDRIDQVLKDDKANLIQHMLVYLPLSSNQYTLKQSSLLTYSVYLLLSSIGELIRKVKFKDINITTNGFYELSQLRAYMMPDFRLGNSDSGLEANAEPQERPKRKSDEINIEQFFTDWVDTYENPKIAPHLLGKISTRFFFALTAIENKASGKKLGEIFHAHIVALMNAILIEDCRENTDVASAITLSNTNFSDGNFLSNLDVVIAKRVELENAIVADEPDSPEALLATSFERQTSFSRWLLACPLLLAYLKPEKSLQEKLTLYCRLPKAYKVFDLEIFKYLDEISVKTTLNLSLNRQNDYPDIEATFKSNEFNESSLSPSNLKDMKAKLKEMGISYVTANSIEKYIKWKGSKSEQ